MRSHVHQSPAPHRPKLHYLQCLRGLAALTVVLSHLPHWAAQSRDAIQIYDTGVVAVFVFFAISGYIIAYSHRGETGWRPARAYAAKRAFRILPAYLLFSAAAFAVHELGWFTWDHYVTRPHGTLGLVAALTLLPLNGGQSVSFLAVGWSLFYEVVFYALFAAFFISRRVGISVVALTAAMVVVSKTLLPISDPFLSWMSLLLLAGCAFGLYRGRLPLSRGMYVFLGVSGLAFLGAGIRHPLQPRSEPCALIGAALVTLCAIGLDQAAGAQPDGRVHGALHRLGDISYSLYLCHTVVQSVLYHFVGAPRLGWGIGAAYVVAPLIVAWASYRWIERPGQQLGRLVAGIRGAEPAPATTPAAAVETPSR